MSKREYEDWELRAKIVTKHFVNYDEPDQNWATHELAIQARKYDQTIRESFVGDPIENWFIYAEQVCNMTRPWSLAVWEAVTGEAVNADVRTVSPKV